MCTPIAMVSATVGSLSQFGPSSPVNLKISVLITPHSGLNMKRTERMVGIEGTAQGRMNSTDSHLIQGRCWAKKPDRNSAIIILMLMPIIRKISVLTAARVVSKPRPALRGERSKPKASGEGLSRRVAFVERAAHPDPLPARAGRG